MIELQAYDFETVEELDLNMGSGGFVRLEDGKSVKLRFVRDFSVVKSFYVKKGESYRTTPSTEKPEALAAASESYKVFFHVLDRADNELKVFEAPYTVFKAIKDLKEDPDWTFKNLPPYDLTIYRVKGNKTSYRVVASPNRDELDGEIQKKVEELKPMPKIASDILKNDEQKYQEKYGQSMYAPVGTTTKELKSKDEEINIDDLPF